MATIKDITGSRSFIRTVDRVLHDWGMVSPETKARILDVMKELDYKPNHLLPRDLPSEKEIKTWLLIRMTRIILFIWILKGLRRHEKAEELKQYGVQFSSKY